jgi:hypothetical protein
VLSEPVDGLRSHGGRAPPHGCGAHIEVKQAKKLMEALLKGDPRRWRVIKQLAKEMWAGLVT